MNDIMKYRTRRVMLKKCKDELIALLTDMLVMTAKKSGDRHGLLTEIRCTRNGIKKVMSANKRLLEENSKLRIMVKHLEKKVEKKKFSPTAI